MSGFAISHIAPTYAYVLPPSVVYRFLTRGDAVEVRIFRSSSGGILAKNILPRGDFFLEIVETLDYW
ncbi:MAG: hypothetical protein ACYC6N_04080 [Pirellulaceae bacterium]